MNRKKPLILIFVAFLLFFLGLAINIFIKRFQNLPIYFTPLDDEEKILSYGNGIRIYPYEDPESYLISIVLYNTGWKIAKTLANKKRYAVEGFFLGMPYPGLVQEITMLERKAMVEVIYPYKPVFHEDKERYGVAFVEWKGSTGPLSSICDVKRIYLWWVEGFVYHISAVMNCLSSQPSSIVENFISYKEKRWEEWQGENYYIACLGMQHRSGSWVIAELSPGAESHHWILSYTIRPCFFDPKFDVSPFYSLSFKNFRLYKVLPGEMYRGPGSRKRWEEG